MKTRRRPVVVRMSNEPVEPSRDEVLRELATFEERDGIAPEKRRDAETLHALFFSGFRVVRTCSLCAAQEGATIPACPNVATHTVRESRGVSSFSGFTIHICDAHARGRRTRAKASKRRA